ncbi:MAG: flagellar assembly protein FliH [Chromatiales bacterium]|nr:flagellar assembly protein FliH [Chromatiales bacterium]
MAAVREAMAALPAAARKVRLHLNPDDAALVREQPAAERGGPRLAPGRGPVDRRAAAARS